MSSATCRRKIGLVRPLADKTNIDTDDTGTIDSIQKMTSRLKRYFQYTNDIIQNCMQKAFDMK